MLRRKLIGVLFAYALLMPTFALAQSAQVSSPAPFNPASIYVVPADVFDKDPQGVGQAVQRVVENIAGQISIHNESKPAQLELNIHR